MMKEELVIKGHSFALAIGSFIFGINLLYNRIDIQGDPRVFYILESLMSSWAPGVLLSLFALIKIFGLILRNSRLRLAGLVGMSMMWTLTLISFGIRAHQGSSNFGVIFSVMVLLHCYVLSARGRFK